MATNIQDNKAVIELVDMSSKMQEYGISTALRALNKYNHEYKIATFIKREFDKKYGQTWHCIVGHNFGSCVSRENKHFIHSSSGGMAILLYKTGKLFSHLFSKVIMKIK
jgi:dynein light chain LC8-type